MTIDSTTPIVGIGHFVAHDSNAALISNGAIRAACSEERFTRRKKDGAFPASAIEYVTRGLSGKPTVVAAYLDEDGFREAHRDGRDPSREDHFRDRHAAHLERLRDVGVTAFVGHHASHAAGAYFTSGLGNAVVITYDGGIVCEPWLATLWSGDGLRLRPICRLTFQDGATAAIRYSAVTRMLGFVPEHDEGKVTALAAKGVRTDDCESTLRAALDSLKAHRHHYEKRVASEFAWIRSRHRDCDIAATIQQMTEDAVVRLIRQHVGDPGSTNCVLAGGLFANVALNLRIKRMGFREVYVYPAMGDEGLGAGAAMAFAVSQGQVPVPLDTVFCGPEYTPDDIRDALRDASLTFEQPPDIEDRMADLLAGGSLVARFDGRMEFGPRALGHRSILYRTDDPTVGCWLNRRLQRSSVMPFAPVTLRESAHRMYRELDGLSRCTSFMTTVLPCQDEMRRLSPAVVHDDGTARPQIVEEQSNPSLYRVLRRYHSLTGVPSLINTSFNMHGEPIVRSPEDAIRCFLRARIDHLAIGPFLVPHPGKTAPRAAQ